MRDFFQMRDHMYYRRYRVSGYRYDENNDQRRLVGVFRCIGYIFQDLQLFFDFWKKKCIIFIFLYNMVDGVWISVRHMVTTRFWVLGLVYEMYWRIVECSRETKRRLFVLRSGRANRRPNNKARFVTFQKREWLTAYGDWTEKRNCYFSLLMNNVTLNLLFLKDLWMRS